MCDGFCPIGETVALSNVDNLTSIPRSTGVLPITGIPPIYNVRRAVAERPERICHAESRRRLLLGTPQARVEIQPGDRVRVSQKVSRRWKIR